MSELLFDKLMTLTEALKQLNVRFFWNLNFEVSVYLISPLKSPRLLVFPLKIIVSRKRPNIERYSKTRENVQLKIMRLRTRYL